MPFTSMHDIADACFITIDWKLLKVAAVLYYVLVYCTAQERSDLSRLQRIYQKGENIGNLFKKTTFQISVRFLLKIAAE